MNDQHDVARRREELTRRLTDLPHMAAIGTGPLHDFMGAAAALWCYGHRVGNLDLVRRWAEVTLADMLAPVPTTEHEGTD